MPITKIFSRRYAGAPTTYVPFLAPWWGVPEEDPDSLHAGQFTKWASRIPPEYALVESPDEADAFVLSIPWKVTRGDEAARAFADEQIREAAAYGKQIMIFFDSDHDDLVDWPEHAVVFRFSIYCDTRRPQEFSIPTFSQDFLALNCEGVLRVREKKDVPSVGFCGYAPPMGCSLSKTALREVGRYAVYRAGLLKTHRELVAHAPRVLAISALRRAPGVDARFIVRNEFGFNRWGVLQPGGTPETAAQRRREFIENLNDTDYALCVRGLANCSIRFYEALSLGRIPIFVNTACVLPYDWIVDWKRVCFWIEESDLGKIGQKLREFHATLSPEAFAAKQRLAREMFERWISPEGFFTQLHRHLRLANRSIMEVPASVSSDAHGGNEAEVFPGPTPEIAA
jgi:hypothetical protein